MSGGWHGLSDALGGLTVVFKVIPCSYPAGFTTVRLEDSPDRATRYIE